MAPDDERDLIEAVVTCEGNLHDPDFSERFQTLVNNLKTVLYTKEEPFKIRKVEPWNSVRVTISIPKEAAQRLRVLAQQGSHVLRQLGILSVQVEGDQVISLTLAGRYNNEPQEVILRPSDAPIPSTPLAAAASSSSSLPVASTVPLPVAATSAAPVAGPSGVKLDILSSSTSSAFRSPNVVAPSGEAIPLPPKNASGAPRPPLGGPFPFASMTHAAQAMQRNESSNPLINTANSTNSPSPSISPAPSGVASTPITPNPTVNAVPPVNTNNSIAPVNSSVGASQQTTVTIPVLVQTQTANHTAPVSVGLSVQGVPLTNINLTNVTVKSDQVTRYILNSSSNVNTNAISQASPSQSLQLQLVNVNVPPPYPGVNSNSSSVSNLNSNNNTNNSSNHLVHHHHHLKQQQAHSSSRAAASSSSNSSATVTMVGAASAGVSVGQSSGGKNNGNFVTPSEPVRLSGTGTLKARTIGQVQGEAKSKPSQPPPHAVLKSLLAQGKEPSAHPHSSQAPPQLTSSGKPRQFLINPLTGHLEPMPSESSSESEASEDDDETEVVQQSRGKGSRLLLTANMMKSSINVHNLPANIQMSDTAKAIASIESASSSLMQKINASLNPQRIIRPGSPASSSGRKSRDESLNPSFSTKDIMKEKDTPVVVNSVPGEKIKLRLKLEKSEPVMSSAYKVEFMKKSEKSSLSSSGGLSGPSSSGGTSPAPGEQPRVPPLHISLRGKNAAVVVSPRREDKDKDFSKSMLEQSLGTNPSSASSEKLINSFKLQNTKRIKSRLKSSDSTNSNDSDKFSGSSKKATKISRPRLSKDNSSGSSWSEGTSVSSGIVDGIEDPLKSRLHGLEDKTVFSSQNQIVECNHASAVVDKVSNLPSKVQAGGLADLISGNTSVTNTVGKAKKSRRKSELLASRAVETLSSNSSNLPLNVASQQLAEISHAQGTQLMKHLSQSQSTVVNDSLIHETNVGISKTATAPISCDIDSKETSKTPEKVSVSTSTPGGLVPSGTSNTLIAKDSLNNAPKGTAKPPDIPKLQKGPVPKELEITLAQVNTVIPEAKVSKSPKPMPELLALPLSSPDKSTDHSHFSISSNPHHPLTQFHHQNIQSKEPKAHPGPSGSPLSTGANPTTNSAMLSRSLMTEMVNAALRSSQSSVTPSLLSQQQSQSQQSSQSQLLNKLLSDRQKHKEKDVIQTSFTPLAINTSLPVLKEKEREQSSKQPSGVSNSTASSSPPSSNLSNRVKGNTPTILRSRVQSNPRISTGTSTDKEQTPVPMPTLTPSPALKSLLEKRKQQIPSSSISPLPPVQIQTQSQKSSQETTEEMEAEVAKVQRRLNQIGGVEIEVRKVSTEEVPLPNKTLRDKVEVEVQLCVSSSLSDPKVVPQTTSNNTPNTPSLDSATSASALKPELVTMGAPVLDGSGGSSSSSNTNLNASALSLPLAVALPPITKAEDPSGAPGEDSGIDSMDALSEKSPNQGESPARKESDQFCDSSSVTTTKNSHFVDATNTNIVVNSNCSNINSIDASNPVPPNLLLQPADAEVESVVEKDHVEVKTDENDTVLTITCSSMDTPTPMEIIEEKDANLEVTSVNVSGRDEGIGDGITKGVENPVRNQVPCESIDITVNKNQSMQMEEMPTNSTPLTQIVSMEIDAISTPEVLIQTTVLPEPCPSSLSVETNAIAPTVAEPNQTISASESVETIKMPEPTQENILEPVQSRKVPESVLENKSPEANQKIKVTEPIPPSKPSEKTKTTIPEISQSTNVPKSAQITAVLEQLSTVPEPNKTNAIKDITEYSNPSEDTAVVPEKVEKERVNTALGNANEKINIASKSPPAVAKSLPTVHTELPPVIEVMTTKADVLVDIPPIPPIPSGSKVTVSKLLPETQITAKKPVSTPKEMTISISTTMTDAVTVPVKATVKDELQKSVSSKVVPVHLVKPQNETPKSVKVEIVSESSMFTKSPIKIHTVKCGVEKVTTPTQTEIKGVPRHYNIITARPYVSVLEKDTVSPIVSPTKPFGTVVIESNKPQKVEIPSRDNITKSVTATIVAVNSSEKVEPVLVDVPSESFVESNISIPMASQNSEAKSVSGQKEDLATALEKVGANASVEKPVKLGIEAISAALKGRAAASMMQPKGNTVVQNPPVVKPNLATVPTSPPKQVQISIPKEPVVKVEKEIQTAKYVPMRKQMEMLEAHKAAALVASQNAQRAVAAGHSSTNEVHRVGVGGTHPQPDGVIKTQAPIKKDSTVKQTGDKKEPAEVGKLDVPIVQVKKSKASSTPPPELMKEEQFTTSGVKDVPDSQTIADKSKDDLVATPVVKEQIAEIAAADVKKVEELSTDNGTALNANTVSHNSSSCRVMPTQVNPMPKSEETIVTTEKLQNKCKTESNEASESTIANQNLPMEVEDREAETVKSCEPPLQQPQTPVALVISETKDPSVPVPNVCVEKEKEIIISPSTALPTGRKSEDMKEGIPVTSTFEAKQSEVIETDGMESKKEKVNLSSHVKDPLVEKFEPVPVKIIEARPSFNPQVSAQVEVDELKLQLARKNNTPKQPAPVHNLTKDIKLDGTAKVTPTPRPPEPSVERKKSPNAVSTNVLPVKENISNAQPKPKPYTVDPSSKEPLNEVPETAVTKIKPEQPEPPENPPALVPAVSIAVNPPAISITSQQQAKSVSCSPPKLQKAEATQIKVSSDSSSSNRIFQDKPPKLSKAIETERPATVATGAAGQGQRKAEEKDKERPKTELKTQMNLIAPGGKIQFQSLNANQSINLARTLPNMIQLSKATTASLATGISKIPIVSAANQCTTTKVAPMVTLGSISVPIQGGSTTTAAGSGQTVFAIHPNVSLPANISHHLQHHHSSSITVIPTNPKMLPIKLVTLPKQTQTQLQSIPNLNRSSPLLEAVNIVTNTSGRAGSPNPKGSPVQNTPLNLGSVSVPGGNIHLVPISVASAAGGSASPVKVIVSSPVKMQPMLLKSVMMANPQTTIRMVRPDLRPQLQAQQEIKTVNTPPSSKTEPANKTPDKSPVEEVTEETPKAKSPNSDSMYKDVDGVEILDTGSPGANEEDLPFEADIIHDEKDLADVLAGEIIATDVIENGIEMSCLDGPYDFGKDGEDSPSRRESVDSPDFQRFSASSKGFKSSWHSTSNKESSNKRHLNSMPDSPIPVMRSSSPLYTYSNSNRSARNSRSRSPSPPEPDVHGEDQEIIDCLSRSPSQPKLSPQNKPPPILERENNEYGSPVKPELTADHTYMANSTSGESKGKLDQELSIEIPSVDSPVSAHHVADERKSTRSTRSNTRLVSPDITAFRSDTPKPQKFTSKPDAALLKNSPKPSPTGSLKMLSPTVVGTPSSSTRSSPVSNQLLISTPATTTGVNSSSRGKTPVTNKRKRQESDSSSASKDENIEEKSEVDLNSRPGKRRCSENAAELIKACIGVEDTPKRNSSLIKKMEDSKGKDLKGKMAMMTVVEETEDQLDLLLGDPTLRSRGGRSSRGSSEDRSSSRGSSVHRNTVSSRMVTKDEEQRETKTNSRVNNRVKDTTAKSKCPPGSESTHVNSTPLKKSAGRRSNRATPAKEKSPLTPAKTRTNVRKDPVVLSGGSADKSSTPSTSPENENPRRKTRSSVAVGMPDSDMQSFKRRRVSKDTKS